MVWFAFGTICGITDAYGAKLKLIEQKPIFDTSVLPKSPFKLELKHSAIVYPEDLRIRTGAKFVNLQGNNSSVLLKAGTSTTVTAVPITTIQRSMSARFGLDLQALIPKIAPDLSRQLQAQIDKANRELAARAEATPRSLAPPSTPKLASLTPSRAPVAPDLTGAVDSARRAPVPSMLRPQSPNAAPLTNSPRDRVPPVSPDGSTSPTPGNARGRGTGLLPPANGLRGSGNPQMPDIAALAKSAEIRAEQGLRAGLADARGKLRTNSSAALNVVSPKTDVKLVVPRTDVKLVAPDTSANLVLPATSAKLSLPNAGGQLSPEVAARLATAQTNAKLIAPSTQAQIEAARAQAKLAAAKMPALIKDVNGELITPNATILWDAWHKRFAKLAGDALIGSINNLDAPLGANSVSVTITPDNHLTASLSKRSNPKFDQAVLQAYKSLDGNRGLSFPVGSLRSSVTFIVENKHAAKGVASVVNSKTLTGDQELLRVKP